MATFVIVHGGWGGGWEWTQVARLLRARGHEAFTPTLTGMGDRSHIVTGPVIDLSTHVEDIVAVFEFEDLNDVILCAGSYGGMPVTGAADRVPGRVAMVVYIDALTPLDGESALDILPDSFGEQVRAGLAEHGEHWRMPFPPRLQEALIPPGSIPDDERERLLSRVRPQPAATFATPVYLSGASDSTPRAFIRCTMGDYAEELGGDPIAQCAARARAAGWLYRELATGHDPNIYDPEGLTDLLEELAGVAAVEA